MHDKKKKKVRKNGINGIKRAKNTINIIEKKISMTEKEKANGDIDHTVIQTAIFLRLKTGKKKKRTILNAEIEMKEDANINQDIDHGLVLDPIQVIEIEEKIMTKGDPICPIK